MLTSTLLRPLGRALEPESMDTARAALVYDSVARAHEFLDRMFAHRLAGLGVSEGNALDVGCGSGRLSTRLGRLAPGLSITAVDLSKPMLALARANAREAGLSNVRFMRADGKCLPFKDGRFDLVFSQHTFHHLPEPRAMLREMARVASAGAWVAVRDLCRPARAGLLRLYVGTVGHIYDRLGEYAEVGKAQYEASLAAALSYPDWLALAESCGLQAACVSRRPLINHVDLLFRKSSRGPSPAG